jgi:anti-sigma B factor antagonist
MDETSGVSRVNALAGSASDDDDMTLEVTREGGNVIVAVKGEIDLMTVARLSGTLSSEMGSSEPGSSEAGSSETRAPSVIVVDLDGVEFLASMGITTLALAAREAAGKQIDFRVVAGHRRTLRPLQITGMTDVLAIYASRAEALSAPRSAPGSGGSDGRQQGDQWRS